MDYRPAGIVVDADLSRKLERERDKAIAALSAIEERFVDGCDTYEDWKFMGGIARSFLGENSQADQP